MALKILAVVFSYGVLRTLLLGYLSWRRRQLFIPMHVRVLEVSAASVFALNAAGILLFTAYFVAASWGWAPIY